MIAKLGADESKDMIYDNISQEMLHYDKPYKTNPIRLCVENKIVCVCGGGGGGGVKISFQQESYPKNCSTLRSANMDSKIHKKAISIHKV